MAHASIADTYRFTLGLTLNNDHVAEPNKQNATHFQSPEIATREDASVLPPSMRRGWEGAVRATMPKPKLNPGEVRTCPQFKWYEPKRKAF